jgi:O-antigen/teichoic acid export membrane protein
VTTDVQIAPPAEASSGRSLGRHAELIRNALSLFNATMVASVLGFAFWAVAARSLPRSAVGYGSAATSAMTFLGTIGMFGMGSLLIGELPRLRRGRAALAAAATLICVGGAATLAIVFVLIGPLFGGSMRTLIGGPWSAALLVVGVMLTAATLVLDQATIGVMRGGLQLSRNAVFAVGKLLLLFIPAIAVRHPGGVWILAAWTGGLAVSLVALAVLVRRSGTSVLPRPDWRLLRSMRRTAGAHNALNLVVQGPRLLLPVLVTVLVSSEANAAFYVAYMIVTFLYIVPTHLSTVLFAVVAKDPSALRTKIRFTLRVSAILGAVGVLALVVLASPVLGVLGGGYAAAALVLRLLALGYLPTTVKLHYIAVCRAADRIGHAAIVLGIGAVLEIGGAAIGAFAGGLTGLTVGFLLAMVAEAAMTGRTVARAAISGTAPIRR